MTGDEPADIQEYAAKNPSFPRESTLDQSFDESQFESYRALGYHVATTVFADPLSEAEELSPVWKGNDIQDVFVRNNQRLFSALQKRWAAAPTNLDDAFAGASGGWLAVQETLRSDAGLGGLSRDIYPELPAPEAAELTPEAARTQLHEVAQMIQVMEDAWVGLKLRGYRDLPQYRGWMSVFRRWASTDAFRRYWPILRIEYSQGFVRFCEAQLRLKAVTEVRRYPIDGPFAARALDRLGREFAREWPERKSLRAILHGEGTDGSGPSGDPLPLWLITQSPARGSDESHAYGESHACGVVTLWADPQAGEYEMFVWIERAYRSIGIGSRCAKTFLDEVRRLDEAPGSDSVTIRVRYPKEGWKSPNDMEFGLWRNFFSHYDFGPVKGEKLNRPTGEDVLLKKTFVRSRAPSMTTA